MNSDTQFLTANIFAFRLILARMLARHETETSLNELHQLMIETLSSALDESAMKFAVDVQAALDGTFVLALQYRKTPME